MKLKERTTATLLIAILMISIFAVAIPVSAQTTWTVGPGTTYDFVTIEGAIVAASSGDTIVVAAGIYSSTSGEVFPITVDKSLTLKGAQFGVDPTVTGARTTEALESVIDAPDTPGNAIDISANNVILDGFTIKNVPSVNVPGDVRYGIKVTAQSGDHSVYSSDITIQNNILTENNRGIFLLDNENSLVRKNLITKCESTTTGVHSGGSGINLSYVKPSTHITENLLTENVAKGSYYGPILVAYGGQYTQPTITKNQIINNYGTTWGIVIVDASAIIRNNKISGNQGGGIWTLWITAVTPPILIENNEITGNAGQGIYTAGYVIAHYNNIFGNGYGISNYGSLSIDATLNWWGHASGPGGVGPGSGDAVSTNILYDPWLLEPWIEPITVEIDIKPGSDPNSINLKSKGLVPVAILGSETFDVMAVDLTTLRFGPGEAEPFHDLTVVHMDHIKDANLDGFMDLVLHFKTQEVGLTSDSTEATLTGSTIDGTPIEGTDSVNIVGK